MVYLVSLGVPDSTWQRSVTSAFVAEDAGQPQRLATGCLSPFYPTFRKRSPVGTATRSKGTHRIWNRKPGRSPVEARSHGRRVPVECRSSAGRKSRNPGPTDCDKNRSLVIGNLVTFVHPDTTILVDLVCRNDWQGRSSGSLPFDPRCGAKGNVTAQAPNFVSVGCWAL